MYKAESAQANKNCKKGPQTGKYRCDNTSRVFVFTLPASKKLNPNFVTFKLRSLRNYVKMSLFLH